LASHVGFLRCKGFVYSNDVETLCWEKPLLLIQIIKRQLLLNQISSLIAKRVQGLKLSTRSSKLIRRSSILVRLHIFYNIKLIISPGRSWYRGNTYVIDLKVIILRFTQLFNCACLWSVLVILGFVRLDLKIIIIIM